MHYVAILMMTSRILFTKTQKSRYLENETLHFLQIKKFMNYTLKPTLLQKNIFVAGVPFNTFLSLNLLSKLAEHNRS